MASCLILIVVDATAVKTVVVKGKAPVDPECAAHSTMHVLSEDVDVYDVMLNQVFSY